MVAGAVAIWRGGRRWRCLRGRCKRGFGALGVVGEGLLESGREGDEDEDEDEETE